MFYLYLVSIALWYITYGIDIFYVNVTMYLFMLLRIGLKPDINAVQPQIGLRDVAAALEYIYTYTPQSLAACPTLLEM